MSVAGQGYVYRPRYTDRKGKKRLGKVWWIGYSVAGQKHRESSRSTRQADAVDLLNQRLRDRGRGITRRDLEKVHFGDLADVIVADYKKNGRKSLRRLQTSLLHLRPAFDGWRVVDIGEDTIDRYAVDRLAQGSAPGSVNRELAALRRMFVLGKRAGLVREVPVFEMLEEDNVRQGFFEPWDFANLMAGLPAHVRPLAEVGYLTGWRKGELLSRRWRHVDFDEGWLRLEPGETKNRRGRMIPLFEQLRAVLECQYERKFETERRTGRNVPTLFFHDDGRPLRYIRRPWKRACLAAGLSAVKTTADGRQVLDKTGKPVMRPTHIFHDLRRTAARNLVRSGVPTVLAKKFTGHETDSVFQRYAIADETSLKEAGDKYASQLGGQKMNAATGSPEAKTGQRQERAQT